ncbi:tail fiber protein [Bradyrhizobium phage BDU-MI-1]|nr:tail fiber protein [Bradyrhizobium phage BDU-MI-1]
MSTQRYRVINPSGLYIGEDFYALNTVLTLTSVGAKYLLLNKLIALASEQAPVGDPGEPSEDDVMIYITVGLHDELVSLTKLREMFPSIKGDKGDQGDVGPPGSRGQKGDKGDRGEQGRGIALSGAVATFADLPVSASDGDLFVTLDDGHGWAWINAAWNDIGQFRGQKGDQGPVGPQGIRGQVGEKGDKGDPGDPGNPTYASRAELGATNAAASEEAAAGHATDAATSAASALSLAADAQGYRDDAQTAATNAATSETNAASHASAAATSEMNAASSESNAQSSATNAGLSATAASNSAAAALTSEGNAATSAASSTSSASAASTSEANAASSAAAASLSASNAATSETNASTSATNAQNTLNSFKGIYYGALASDPALDPNGAAITDGDFYFNTATKKMRFHNGTAWADMVSGGTQKRFIYTATAGQTTFTGADAFSNALAYTPGCIEVVVNGLWVPYSEYTASNGTSIVLSSGSTAGDVVYVFALAAFTIADVCARSLNGSDILDKAAFRSNLGLTSLAIAAPGHIPAEPSNGTPAAGEIGEVVTASATIGMSNGVTANVTSFTLGAGDWDIYVDCQVTAAGATSLGNLSISVSNTSATIDSSTLDRYWQLRFAAGWQDPIMSPRIGPYNRKLTGPTTFYITALAGFANSSLNVGAFVRARRYR